MFFKLLLLEEVSVKWLAGSTVFEWVWVCWRRGKLIIIVLLFCYLLTSCQLNRNLSVSTFWGNVYSSAYGVTSWNCLDCHQLWHFAVRSFVCFLSLSLPLTFNAIHITLRLFKHSRCDFDSCSSNICCQQNCARATFNCKWKFNGFCVFRHFSIGTQRMKKRQSGVRVRLNVWDVGEVAEQQPNRANIFSVYYYASIE